MGSMNVLIVDDNKDTLLFLKQALCEEGFVTDTAEDGDTALKKADSGDYDLIILDDILPKKTGKEVCIELRKKKKDTRILMLSVGEGAEVKADALNSGADDYLGKPFSLKELLARLQALMRRPEKMTDSLSIENLSLDSNNCVVKYFGKEIKLTPKEFSLLEYMMHNSGKTISRIQILEHVWDMNADLFTNTVEMHISNIRKKLSKKGKKPIIETISGKGYKISQKLI